MVVKSRYPTTLVWETLTLRRPETPYSAPLVSHVKRVCLVCLTPNRTTRQPLYDCITVPVPGLLLQGQVGEAVKDDLIIYFVL